MKKSKKVKKEILDQLKKIPIMEIVCQRTGITRMTLSRWKKEDPEFSKQISEAILEGRQLINDLAESGLIGEVKDRNLSAILHWLKFHHKDYKEKVEVSFDREVIDKALDKITEIIDKAKTNE